MPKMLRVSAVLDLNLVFDLYLQEKSNIKNKAYKEYNKFLDQNLSLKSISTPSKFSLSHYLTQLRISLTCKSKKIKILMCRNFYQVKYLNKVTNKSYQLQKPQHLKEINCAFNNK